MEGLRVFESMEIKSGKGVYGVEFDETSFTRTGPFLDGNVHIIMDSNLVDLYPKLLTEFINHPSIILIEASENSKAIMQVLPVIEQLLDNGARRGHTLLAIGGGVIQDIVCFISSVLFRGLDWKFIPTTLLSQADSCIGSKSSINLGKTKNILGTFNPPKSILICPMFLDTLNRCEILSGIGEILKVHTIDGIQSFDNVARDYDALLSDRLVLLNYIQKALTIKKKYIEVDEYDQGVRNIFNYGHSFGHAIESATKFEIPHGIAVTIGMDMANRISAWRGTLVKGHYERMHEVLRKNYKDYLGVHIPLELLISALKKDKKNTVENLTLILPMGDQAKVERVSVKADEIFVSQCKRYLDEIFI
jgi:3-dehydroquinate synthase